MKDEINELKTQAKEIKSKILSRIQQQLNQEPGAEGMIYMKNVQHDKGQVLFKGPGPDPTYRRVTPSVAVCGLPIK